MTTSLKELLEAADPKAGIAFSDSTPHANVSLTIYLINRAKEIDDLVEAVDKLFVLEGANADMYWHQYSVVKVKLAAFKEKG